MVLRIKNRTRFAGASAMTLAILCAGSFSCGNKNCLFLDRVFGEPSCSDHRLLRTIRPVAPANCAVPQSRNVTVNCPASTGISGQCTSLADGFSVVAVLVPNNAGGNFTDTNGTGFTYTNCQNLLNDVQSGFVAGVLGIYVSDNSTGNRLSCSDVTG